MKRLLIIGLIFSLFIASCGKFCEPDIETFAIPSYLLASVPYQDGQKVRFKARTGRTFTFEVTSSKPVLRIPVSCKECCNGEKILQYEGSLPHLYDSVNNVVIWYSYHFDIDTMMEISFNPEPDPENILNYTSTVRSVQYHVSPLGDFICGNTIYCYDSISIGNSVYHDVIEIQNPWAYNLDWDIFQMLYSREKGILRITFIGPEEFTLVE